MVGAKSAALFASRMSNERSADELRPQNGVPSWTLTNNLTLRTRLLCVLSYGDESWYARRVTLPIQALI